MAKIFATSTATAAACACLFLFLLLFLATQGGAAAEVGDEKRKCETQSHHFKGKCFSDHNCASVCKTEGFPGGNCRGWRQRCFCTKPC